MGFVEKLRAEFIDIVEWVDDSRHTLVWRFPRYHNQIKNGAQLVVRPGQVATFVHQGRIADVFGPGQYELTTRNLPLLSTLQGWKHGFDSPFKAEVYFCTTRQITDLKWGTPSPVLLRDADFGPVRLRAFGTYTLKAEEPKVLLAELVGTSQEFDTEEIAVLLRSIINNCFADLVARSKISVLDLASNYGALSEELRTMVQARIDDEYGLDVPQLYIVNFSLPDEVQQALDARSSMGILGDLSRYQQYQVGAATPAAAENPAGGLAGAGLGMGMGWALSQQFLDGPRGLVPGGGTAEALVPAAKADPPLQVVPEAPLGTPATGWYLAEGGRTEGPFDFGRLAELAQLGRFRPNSLVWVAGMAGWVEAGQLPALLRIFQPPPPPVGPPPAPRR